ncbi:MAG TPA: hypothetical protein VFG69_08220 [Nannocystaceae bacterium]|nr:hypothetical protein [Nannocystaceae bacterium]
MIALGVASGCHAGEGGDFGFADGESGGSTITAAATGSEGSSGAVADTDASSSEGDSGSGESTGAADESTGGPLPTEPCTTLDILLVVDNSDTMAEEQAKLSTAIGPFVGMVQSQLPGVMGSIHVAVLSTDSPDFVTSSTAATCLPFASGANWMAYGDTLSTELACATDVGVAGDPDERPMQMTIDALSPEQLGVDGFNEGFLREDGPLVVVVVTDEEDDLEEVTEWGSPGDPADWVEAVAAVKGGYTQDVVALALVGIDKPNACPEYQWNGMDGAELSPRLVEFTESFERHAVGDVCAGDYGNFLNPAVAQIVAACAEYVPP